MALLILYDPYEWVDPEKGRQGELVHSSQIGARRDRTFAQVRIQETWPELWEKWDADNL